MTRKQRKARARLRSQRYAAERALDALLGPPRGSMVLRHGKSWTCDPRNTPGNPRK